VLEKNVAKYGMGYVIQTSPFQASICDCGTLNGVLTHILIHKQEVLGRTLKTCLPDV
jgi:hypothetical protein